MPQSLHDLAKTIAYLVINEPEEYKRLNLLVIAKSIELAKSEKTIKTLKSMMAKALV
jgi:hypothetical protein